MSAPAPRPTILPVTLTAAAVLFVIIISRRSPDLRTRLAGAAIGAIAAPMIFELPFDPIVIFRFGPTLPGPRPWTLVYGPLLLVEISTLLLLRLSPMVRLTRATFFSVALTLGVWAAWALAGFGYPSATLADCAEHRVEDPGIRRRLHPVSAPPARAWAVTPAR